MREIALVILCLICISHQKSSPESDSYVAAVVDYKFSKNTTQNLKDYLRYIQQASEQEADIVVFPEMTLTRGVKLKLPMHGILKEYPIPALKPQYYHEILVSLSAAARQHAIYVVVNVEEEMSCPSPGEFCPEEKTYSFNTNIVFDRSGAVIDRYRKINLFGEYTRSAALRPELGVFRTDFGVTFGHFICFDLLFQVPATQLVEKHGLTDIVFTTMWFSEMPFLTAVQIQEAYAYTMNVNLLAAGANNVKLGSAGSGIYSGNDGAIISIMPGEAKSHLLVSRVPKVPGQASFKWPGPIYDNPSAPDQLLISQDHKLPRLLSRPLQAGVQEFTLVDKDVSCRFRVGIDQNAIEDSNIETPTFRAFVQDGINKYAQRRVGVVFCAVVACKNGSVDSCPYRFTKEEIHTQFTEIEIKMTTYADQYNNSLDCDNVMYYPTSLKYNKFPLEPKSFLYQKSSQKGCEVANKLHNNLVKPREEILYKVTSPQDELISFGIWGRIYNRDIAVDVSDEDQRRHLDFENLLFDGAWR